MAIKLDKIKNAQPVGEAAGKGFMEQIEGILSKDISFARKGLSDKKKEFFFHELYLLLSAGVDIKTALELTEEVAGKKEKAIYSAIGNQVIQGSTFSEALQLQDKIFTPYEYFSVKIGEETGKLAEILKELAEYYHKKINQRRQITSSLTYPVIVLCTALGAVFFMIKFIVPMFSDVFKRFQGDLPALTQMVIDVSDFMSDYFLLLFSTIAITSILLYSQRKKTAMRKITTTLLLKIPLIGEIVKKVYLARLCQSLALLTSAKVPLVSAIQLVQKMIRFYPIESSLQTVEKEIIAGRSLHESLAKYPVYEKRMTSLVKAAEETNQLEVIFDKIAKQYSDEVEYKSSVIGNMLEPFIIIFLGLIVAVILVSMYLPLFELGSGFGG